jgi:hypothetical protein
MLVDFQLQNPRNLDELMGRKLKMLDKELRQSREVIDVTSVLITFTADVVIFEVKLSSKRP